MKQPSSHAEQENAPANSPQQADAEHSLAQALADYVDLLASEHPVDADTFCRQHPDLEADLRREIDTLHELDILTEPPTDGEPLTEPPIEPPATPNRRTRRPTRPSTRTPSTPWPRHSLTTSTCSQANIPSTPIPSAASILISKPICAARSRPSTNSMSSPSPRPTANRSPSRPSNASPETAS